MKVFMLTFIYALFCIVPLYSQDHSEDKEIMNRVIGFFVAGEASSIYNLFDDTMKGAITADKLTEIWTSLQQQYGKYLGTGDAISIESQGYVIVNQLLDFETTDLDIRLAFNSTHQISGLFFVPPVSKKKE